MLEAGRVRSLAILIANPINGRSPVVAQNLRESVPASGREVSTSAKCAIHGIAKARMVLHLRSMGLRVEVMRAHDPFDLLINGTLRVAIRVALPSVHPVRVQAGKRQYLYQYRSWLFNFHHHARIDRYADVLVCLPADESRGLDLNAAYVIPWEARSGKTFSLHEARRPYRGRYTRYRGAWEQLRPGRVLPVPAEPGMVRQATPRRAVLTLPSVADPAVASGI